MSSQWLMVLPRDSAEASGASEAEKEKETPGGKLNPRTAAESQLKLISLPHPATQQATRFALKSVTEDEKNEDENKKPRLFQVQRIHQSAVPRSWFINQECQRDGSLYTLTPFDVCFLLISLMSIPSATSGNNKESSPAAFVTADTILHQEQYPDCMLLMPWMTASQLDCICDTQMFGDDLCVFRLNEQKTLAWLNAKLDKLVANWNTLEFLHEVHASSPDATPADKREWIAYQVLSDCLNEHWREKLRESRNIDAEKFLEKENQADINYFQMGRPAAGSASVDEGVETASKKSKVSIGAKKLEKAAKAPGMQSISAFFAKKPAKQ